MPTMLSSPTTSFEADERLRWVARVARLLDSQFQLPGTRFRFGLDPLLGLVPVVGDLSTTLISVALLRRHYAEGQQAGSGQGLVQLLLGVLVVTGLASLGMRGKELEQRQSLPELLLKVHQVGLKVYFGTSLVYHLHAGIFAGLREGENVYAHG